MAFSLSKIFSGLSMDIVLSQEDGCVIGFSLSDNDKKEMIKEIFFESLHDNIGHLYPDNDSLESFKEKLFLVLRQIAGNRKIISMTVQHVVDIMNKADRLNQKEREIIEEGINTTRFVPFRM